MASAGPYRTSFGREVGKKPGQRRSHAASQNDRWVDERVLRQPNVMKVSDFYARSHLNRVRRDPVTKRQAEQRARRSAAHRQTFQTGETELVEERERRTAEAPLERVGRPR
jgi:hypothetical protein